MGYNFPLECIEKPSNYVMAVLNGKHFFLLSCWIFYNICASNGQAILKDRSFDQRCAMNEMLEEFHYMKLQIQRLNTELTQTKATLQTLIHGKFKQIRSVKGYMSLILST